jgi:hypothetical protein
VTDLRELAARERELASLKLEDARRLRWESAEAVFQDTAEETARLATELEREAQGHFDSAREYERQALDSHTGARR